MKLSSFAPLGGATADKEVNMKLEVGKINKIKYYLKIISIGFLICSFIFPLTSLNAALVSDSYIIHENVLHTFDGPVISGVSSSVSGTTATVVWSTDIPADSYVIYDTSNTFANSKEQGSSDKSSTSHSVAVSGLNGTTIYYYKVKSTRTNGGVTTDNTVRSFTTGASEVDTLTQQLADAQQQLANTSGGGMLIIDKTDKIAPLISNIAVRNITLNSATITWKTDEEATSFIEYGQTSAYGSTYGQWEFATDHSVTLINLEPETSYNFRVLSSDGSANLTYSTNKEFATIPGTEWEETGTDVDEEPAVSPGEEDDETNIAQEATRRAIEFINRIFPEVSLNQFGPTQFSSIASLEDLANFVPAPILSGEPRIEIGGTEAIVSWTTDVDANSLVAVAPEDRYNPDADEPYIQIVGDPENLTREHEVRIYNLEPNTVYHYQIRSKGNIGPTTQSRDFVFRTGLEEFEITSYFPEVLNNESAVFKWVTNKEASSAIRYIPYRGGILAIEEAKSLSDDTLSVIHEITVRDFEAGVLYDIEISSRDRDGNLALETITGFSTSEDDLPPVIQYVRANSTIFFDESDKIQTIISWTTNEPATSKVYYQEGVHGKDTELKENTRLNINYTREHVMVISNFKPGTVYSFRVESIDSGGNESISKVHTFMTAKKRESIIQIILDILSNTFSWIKKLL